MVRNSLIRKVIILLKIFFFFIRFPFEWKTPIGFFFACSMEGFFFTTLFEIAVYPLFIYIGICNYSIAFISDLIANINNIKDKYENSTKRSELTKGEIRELKEKFQDVIKFHTEAVELSVAYVSIFKTS